MILIPFYGITKARKIKSRPTKGSTLHFAQNVVKRTSNSKQAQYNFVEFSVLEISCSVFHEGCLFSFVRNILLPQIKRVFL